MRPSARILCGDVLDGLRSMPDASVHCCVTSPPYWGLRDYGVKGQIGLEQTPEAYVARMVEVFREVRRVLRDDGTLWLNLGDSYCSQGGERKYGSSDGTTGRGDAPGTRLKSVGGFGDGTWDWIKSNPTNDWATDDWLSELQQRRAAFLKPKDLVGIPWRVAFALQADGWWLRQDIIWHKPNPMPESVRDRCTKAHEYVFLLTKSERYFYDAEAVSEPVTVSTTTRLQQPTLATQAGSDRVPGKTNGPMKAVGPRFGGNKFGDSDDPKHANKSGNVYQIPDASGRRNRRSVWTVTTKPYSGAHFAVMPADLVEPCIKAGTSEHGCCPVCGAPWERVVERGETDYARLTRDASWREMDAAARDRGVTTKLGEGGQTRNPNGTVPSLRAAEIISSRWAPSCACEQHDVECDLDDDCSCSAGTSRPVPCTVLDPFAGSGTTLAVAISLGRSAIGTELNADYVALAERRISESINESALFLQPEASA